MIYRLHIPPQLTASVHSAMATEFIFHLGGHDPAYLQQAAAEAFALIDQLEARLSFYRESSDVTRLNRAAAGAEVAVSPDTIACLELAAEAAQMTLGAFNAFTGRAAVEAKRQEIPSYLVGSPEPGENDVSGPVISLHPAAGIITKLRAGPWIDLGALGKGYALDQAASLLVEWGITEGCLIAGGSSLRGLGGGRWPLEIGRTKLVVSLRSDFCLGASGFQFQPGHVIDSRPTPAKSNTVRALVLAPSAALADALSTGAMLLSDRQLVQLVHDQPGVAMLVIDAVGNTHRHGAPFA